MKTSKFFYCFYVLILLFGANVYADLQDGLVIYFSYDNISGKTVVNEVNDKLNGTLEGEAKQVPGFKGMGVALNPDAGETIPGSDFVRVADAPEVNVDKQFTIAMWASGTNFGEYRTLLSKTDSGAYALTVEKGMPNSWIHVAGDYLQVAGKTQIEKNKWYHYALTYDGSDAMVYLNGKEEGKGTRKGTVTICSADFMIGAEPSGKAVDATYPAWHGILDEFYFYNRALTGDEINSLIKRATSVDQNGKLTQTWGRMKVES
jgi:hypothetical protein